MEEIIMNDKEFSVNYMLGDELVNFKHGKEVFFIKSSYSEKYEYCKECKTAHPIGKQTIYSIRSATIFGFNIESNHCYSYNTKNSFTMRIKVIDEDDSSKEFDVNEIFFTEEEAQKRINKYESLNK
jgi:hypothetical protein